MEKYQKYGINPLLISIATDQDLINVSPRPTVAMLPSKYSKIVYKHIQAVNSEFPENIFRLTCEACGRSGDYDLGTLVIPTDNLEHDNEIEKIQALGYFRCKHCNAAGKWELSERVKAILVAKVAAVALGNATENGMSQGVIFGKALIDKEFAPRWGNEAEDYFLEKLAQNPDNAYLWNRLGNTYCRGKRPELAVCAHEQAVIKDMEQIESHFSLGKILIECGELEKASEHLRQAVAFSYKYKQLPAYDLREIVVEALEILLSIYNQSDNQIDMLPRPSEWENNHLVKNQIAATAIHDFEVDFNRRETLYPLAEVYLGERRNELPPEARAIQTQVRKKAWPAVSKVNKQKPPKKNKKRKKR